MKKRTFTLISFLFLLLIVQQKIYAGGFELTARSVKGISQSFGGYSVNVSEATTAFTNPANMTQLEGTHYSFGTYLLLYETYFSNENSRTALGSDISGSNGGNAGDLFFVPTFHWVQDYNSKVKLGFAFDAPYGLKTEYEPDWVGRYDSTKTDLNIFSLQPAIAVQVNSKLSLGLGLQFQYAKATLENAIDQSAFCTAVEQTLISQGASCAAVGLNTEGNAASDAQVSVTGDDWGIAGNFGLLYYLTEKARLGITYRTGINHQLTGDADFKSASAVFTGGDLLTDTDASANLNLPHSASMSLGYQITPAWEILADISWRKWSRFKDVTIDFANPNQPNTVILNEWRDTFRYALGANYKMHSKLTLRAGMAYDQTPVRNASYRSSSIPDNSGRWYTFGATLKLDEQSEIDLGYMHIDYSRTGFNKTVNNNVPTLQHVLSGRGKTVFNGIGLQYNRKL